jgi:hypothetical protein
MTRRIRLSISRALAWLAIVAIPDGEGDPTVKLSEAEWSLKRRIEDLSKENGIV